MKKRRLKKWIKNAIYIIIIYIICLLLIFSYVKRVEYFNNNIEKCGNNYCEGR